LGNIDVLERNQLYELESDLTSSMNHVRTYKTPENTNQSVKNESKWTESEHKHPQASLT